MSDFENRVRDSLARGAEGAPPAVGLVEGARVRLRRRRRTTGAVVATVVVLAAVPLVVALLGSDDSGPGDDAEVATLPPIPDGWRWESWHDLQVAVPGDWTEGSASQYCIGGDPDSGVVDRGDRVSTMVACPHAVGPGVIFHEAMPMESLLDTAGVARRLTIGGNTVDVVAPDLETVDAILASVHRFRGADSRGCASTFDAPRVMSAAGEYVDLPEAGVVSVCQYTGLVKGDVTTYTLRASATLSEEGSARLLDAIQAAPNGGSAECSADPSGAEPPPWAAAYEVRTDDGRVAATTAASCEATPLRTAEGEFDGTELMTSVSQGDSSASATELMPAS